MSAEIVDNAWRENDDHDDDARYDESLGEDKADDHCKDEKTQTWVWIVTVRCETCECLEHIDTPDSVEDSSNSLDEESSLLIRFGII